MPVNLENAITAKGIPDSVTIFADRGKVDAEKMSSHVYVQTNHQQDYSSE